MDHKLVSMKIDPKEREKRYTDTVAVDAPIYQWGLGLNLDNEALDKLGIALPKVGTTLMLVAKVAVTSVSAHESDSDTTRSVSLQITDMALETEAAESSLADKLYAAT